MPEPVTLTVIAVAAGKAALGALASMPVKAAAGDVASRIKKAVFGGPLESPLENALGRASGAFVDSFKTFSTDQDLANFLEMVQDERWASTLAQYPFLLSATDTSDCESLFQQMKPSTAPAAGFAFAWAVLEQEFTKAVAESGSEALQELVKLSAGREAVRQRQVQQALGKRQVEIGEQQLEVLEAQLQLLEATSQRWEEHSTAVAVDDNVPNELERQYLNRLMKKTKDMPLELLDKELRSDTSTPGVPLDAIYTALLTDSFAREPAPEDLESSEEPLELHKLQAEDSESRRLLSALEVLETHPYLVLLGDPGGGKSTFVDFVARCLAGARLGHASVNLDLMTAPLPQDDGTPAEEPQPWTHGALFPFRVILRDFAASGLADCTAQGFRAFIEKTLETDAQNALSELICRRLRGDRALLLLDGLDEVEVGLRRAVVGSALEFIAGGGARVLITSRVHPYEAQKWKPSGFHRARLAPFSKGQIRRFAQLWYRQAAIQRPHRFTDESAADRGEQFLRAVLGSARLTDLARRPILLTLMIALDAFSRMPEHRHELYEESVDLLLDSWDTDRLRDETQPKSLSAWLNVGKPRIRRAFEELAFEVHLRQQGDLGGAADIPEKDLKLCLSDLVTGADKDVNLKQATAYLKERLGLLVRRDDGIYAFPHRSFQEYLAACHLSKRRRQRLVELTREDPDRWREPALLAGARMDEQDVWDLVERLILPSSPPSPGDAWSVLIAGEILAESTCLRSGTLEPTPDSKEYKVLTEVRDCLQSVLSSKLPNLERHTAGQCLGTLGDPRFDASRAFLPRGDSLGFIRIPAGPFLFGSDPKQDGEASSREQPQSRLKLDEYWMGQWPVTVAQFRAYVEASGEKPNDPDALTDGDPHMPVIWISFEEANGYCRWLTRQLKTWADSESLPSGLETVWQNGDWAVRLPTEQEWEKAARGKNSGIYPWGNTYQKNSANDARSGIPRRNVVGIFAQVKTPYGCQETSGNVWEWTSSPWTKSHSKEDAEKDQKNSSRVVRGGSFGNGPQLVRCAYRSDGHPDFRDLDLGFRVVLASFSGL